MTSVNPKILIWARKTAGFSIAVAAHKLAITEDRLTSFENGENSPTRRQIANMADKYRRPLLTFYLEEPPKPKSSGEDFRTLSAELRETSQPLLSALLRNVYARQSLIKSALEEEEEAEVLTFVGSAKIQMGVEAVSSSIREVLKVSREAFQAQRTPSEAFALLRSGAEKAGIFVLLMGNLGTHHTDIDVRAFRGFALSDPIAPFVVINEKDARTAWAFSLIHELTHIWLGQTGISGYDGEAAVEKFCDNVAADFLLRRADLEHFQAAQQMQAGALLEDITQFALARNVSRKMVAYNLLSTNRVTQKQYALLSAELDSQRINRPRNPRKNGSGPDYYTVRRHRNGKGLVSVVKRMVAGGALTTTKAGTVLGVKPTAVPRLVDNGAA